MRQNHEPWLLSPYSKIHVNKKKLLVSNGLFDIFKTLATIGGIMSISDQIKALIPKAMCRDRYILARALRSRRKPGQGPGKNNLKNVLAKARASADTRQQRIDRKSV